MRTLVAKLPIVLLTVLTIHAVPLAASSRDTPSAAAEPVDRRSEAKYLFAIAQELRQEADYEGARTAFEQALEADPDEPYLRLAYAEFLYQLGELARASKEAEAVRSLGENAEALRLMARIELRQADKSTEAFEKAVQLYRELSELLPDDIEARVSSGRLLMSLGRFEEAAAALSEAYDLNPGDLRLASMLMTALQGSQDPTVAEIGLKKLIENHPGLLDARLALANLFAEQRRHRESVAVLEGASEEQRDEVDVLRLLALELYRIGAWDRSLAASERWLEIAPQETPALYLEGLALSALARFEEAEENLRVLYEADDKSLDVARVLAEVVERQGRPAEAAQILSNTAEALEALGQAELALRARLELIDLEVRAENWERVIEITQAFGSSEDFPGRGELMLVRGQAFLEAGRIDEAIALFDALGADSEVGDRASARAAEALFRAGRADDGETKLRKLAASGEPGHVILAARAFHRLELYEQAIPYWLDAKTKQPDSLETRFWLASAYERSGRRDSAISEFRSLLDRDELFAPALNYLGYMWAEKGENLTEAAEMVEKAVALEPNNGAYIDSLGWVYFQLGEYERALGYLEKAAELVGDDAVVFEHLGDTYHALGRRAMARTSYQKSVALAGENEAAVQEKLDRLYLSDDS